MGKQAVVMPSANERQNNQYFFIYGKLFRKNVGEINDCKRYNI